MLNGLPKPCVCILDDRHIEAELALVEYQFSDEVTVRGDFNSLLSRFCLRTIGTGRCRTAAFDGEGESEGKRKRQIIVRNFVEDEFLAAIDENYLSRSMQMWIRIAWSCRRKTYATFRAAPPVPSHHVIIGPIHHTRQVRVRQRKKARLPKAPSGVLSRDTKERPVEFALYAQRKVLKLDGKRMSEFEAWQLEGLAPKPEPVDLSFNSSNSPEMYIWKAESKPVDQSNPHGPVAILNPVDVAALNEQ